MATVKSQEQRRLEGKSRRKHCPRLSHGKIIVRRDKHRNVIALIEASNRDRLPNLVPIRHGRMAQSAFAFFRGTAAIQAYDLAKTPVSGIMVQACGDCHLTNFGGFATPERTLVFDINDFDETYPAPFEWDVKRLAASFMVAARWRGFKASQALQIATEVARSYRESMLVRMNTGVLEAWYSRVTMKEIVGLVGGDAEVQQRVAKRMAEAAERTNEQVANKLTTPHKGLSRILDQPPLIYHVSKKVVNDQVINTFFKQYRETLSRERRALFDRFTPVDVALKVVGVGSVGTRCFVALFFAAPNDPLFLQVKEARASVLEPYVKAVHNLHNGERVVFGQRLMQSASDIFLGWAKGPAGRTYYVRQLRDMKVSPDIESQDSKVMRKYARLCGMTLARAHDKAGDAAMIAGYLGNNDHFDEAIGNYAVGYADQVERDYNLFMKAIRNGRLKTDLSRDRLAAILR